MIDGTQSGGAPSQLARLGGHISGIARTGGPWFLCRPHGWEDRLGLEFTAASKRAREWGVHDCASFADRCVVAIFGASPWTDEFRAYETEMGAALATRRAGGFEAQLDRFADRIDWRRAWRGDLAVIDVGGDLAVGVVDVGAVLVAGDPAGLAARPLSSAVTVWGLAH